MAFSCRCLPGRYEGDFNMVSASKRCNLPSAQGLRISTNNPHKRNPAVSLHKDSPVAGARVGTAGALVFGAGFLAADLLVSVATARFFSCPAFFVGAAFLLPADFFATAAFAARNAAQRFWLASAMPFLAAGLILRF